MSILSRIAVSLLATWILSSCATQSVSERLLDVRGSIGTPSPFPLLPQDHRSTSTLAFGMGALSNDKISGDPIVYGGAPIVFHAAPLTAGGYLMFPIGPYVRLGGQANYGGYDGLIGISLPGNKAEKNDLDAFIFCGMGLRTLDISYTVERTTITTYSGSGLITDTIVTTEDRKKDEMAVVTNFGASIALSTISPKFQPFLSGFIQLGPSISTSGGDNGNNDKINTSFTVIDGGVRVPFGEKNSFVIGGGSMLAGSDLDDNSVRGFASLEMGFGKK